MELAKSGLSDEATNNCKLVVQHFLDSLPQPQDNPIIPEEGEKKICQLTNKICILRATANWNKYSKDLLSGANYEIPTRNSARL